MRTNRVWALVLLLIVQTFAAGFAVIPSQSDTGEWQGPVQFADARSNNTTDSDNDGIVDSYDACPNGQTNWTSSASTDYDSDGCQDSSEDLDDDNDGVADINDACMVGDLGWTSTNLTDYDSDGCRDWGEDLDDDNDGVVDFDDACSMGELGWISSNMTDADGDGCKDATEDPDGGTGGNSSSGCGNDPTYTSLYAYSSLSNYYVNDTFTGIMNVYCQLTNITMTLDYSILDSSNTSVDSGNMSWVGGSSNYTYEFWNTTLNQQGMYGFYAILGYYDANQTWIQVDTDYDSFTVWNQTSGGGNNTGGCGDDPTYASLYAYSYSSYYYVNDTFTGSMSVYCQLTNMTMTLDYTIYDSNNMTYDAGNMSWVANTSTYHNERWNTTLTQAGSYMFEAVLGYYDANQTWTQLDSDYDYFTVWNQTSGGGNNTGGCGDDPTYASLYAYSYSSLYYVNDTFTGSMSVYCQLTNMTMTLDYSILDSSNTTVAAGNMSWVANASTYTNELWNTTTLTQAGSYSFDVILGYYDANQTWTQLDSDYDYFTVLNQTSGGGNNSGGCGDDPTYASLYAYSYLGLYYVNDTFTGSMSVYCQLTNMTMTLDYTIYDSNNMTYDAGNMSWVANTSTYHNERWNTTLTQAGSYMFEAVLGYYDANQTWTQLDSDYDYFTVWNQTSGGGNNTGGCGDDPTYASLYAYSYSSLYYVNDTFTGSMSVYCQLTNMTMTLDYSILDSSNTTVAAGNMSWVANASTYTNELWNTTTLTQAGSYSFDVILGYYDANQTWTQLDSDYDYFTVWNQTSGGGNNTGGCGDDPTYASLYAYSYSSLYYVNDTFTGFMDIYCSLTNMTMTLDYFIVDASNTTVAAGNMSWIGSSSTYTSEFWNTTLTQPGNYTFEAFLGYYDTNQTWTQLDSDYDFFTVWNQNSGGGNNSGNEGNNSSPGASITIESNGEVFVMGDILQFSIESSGLNLDSNYTLMLNNSLTGASTTYTWNASMSSSFENFNTTALTNGTFCFDAYLFENINGSSVLVGMDTVCVTVGMSDMDQDMISDSQDNCPTIYNPNQSDLDNDGKGDLCDDDMDGDSVPNAQDAFPMDGDESVDTDGDGIGNNADTDDDGDGLNDADDAFPLDANEQTDLDGDNVGDNADADDDNDGVVDSIDNCPFVANPDQADGNANGIGTVCDSSEDTTGGETGGNNTGGNNTGNNTGGETGGNNTGGETGGNNTGGETGGNNTGGETGGETGGNNTGGETGGETGGNNTGGETGGNETSSTDDESIPALGALGTMVAMTVGFMAASRRFDDA